MPLRRLLFAMALVLITGTSFIYPVDAFAAEDLCDCWCESKEGAIRFTDDADVKMPLADCQRDCKEFFPGYQMAVCATSSDQLPSQNITCFTASQCTKQNGEFDLKFQPPECMTGQRYCYPDASKAAEVTLSTSIGGLSVTGDFGEYIASVYKWMLGVSTTLAIVFMMIAGLRWSLGGLSAEQIGKAKTTIQNALIGLVLLLSTYLILQTVNPSLLKLQVPGFPMIRQVALMDENSSCGYLTGNNGYGSGYTGSPYNRSAPKPKGGKPYTIDPTYPTTCGSVAEVTKDWEGNDVEDGTTCTWDTCPTGSNAKCFVNVLGGQCLACGQVVVGNNYIEPRSDVCAQLSLPEESASGVARVLTTRSRDYLPDQTELIYTENVPIINQCFWTRAGSMMSGFTDPLESLAGTGTCALLTLDCSKISYCEQYDTIPIVANIHETQQLEAIRNHGNQSGVLGFTGSYGDLSLTSICNADPCLVGVEGKTRCYADQPQPRITGSWTDFVSFQGNDCTTLNIQ